jgi:hypothetical protein
METHAVLFTTSELQSAFLHSNDISINTWREPDRTWQTTDPLPTRKI